jgi:hypothetical protein
VGSARRLVVATFDEQGVPSGLGDVVSDTLIRANDMRMTAVPE